MSSLDRFFVEPFSWFETIILLLPSFILSFVGKFMRFVGILPNVVQCDLSLMYPPSGDRNGFSVHYAPAEKRTKFPIMMVVARHQNSSDPWCSIMPWTVNILPQIRDFPVDEGDVWVCSFMKTGTTWVQQMVSLLMTKNFDEKRPLEERFPMLEWHSHRIDDPDVHINRIRNLPKPRTIKSHLPYHLLPSEISRGKVVYVTRNPKDTICSMRPFLAGMLGFEYSGTLDEMAVAMCQGRVPLGSFEDHVKSYWRMKDEKRVLFLTYEGIMQDHRGSVARMAEFLDVTATPEEIDAVVKASTFSSMKTNSATNYQWCHDSKTVKSDWTFMRKGATGSWQNEMSPETAQLVDEWQKKAFADTDFEFQDTV